MKLLNNNTPKSLRGISDSRNVKESFDKLQVNIGLASVDKPIKVIQITSSVQDEGKTTIAVNLSRSYALSEKKVLLIDLDVRRPKIHRNFEIANENGIVDFVAGNCTKEQIIKHTHFGIDVIVSGCKTPFPKKVLESETLKTLILQLRDEYDYIIVDTPPVTAVADPLIICQFVDGTLFVVKANFTRKSLIKESLLQLENARANLIGLTMSSVKYKDLRYGYKSYYYYYE